MQQDHFNAITGFEKPLMDTIKELEREIRDAEQAQLTDSLDKRETTEDTLIAKLPVAHFTSPTMETILEELLPRYEDAHGTQLTEAQASNSYHNQVAETIKTQILQYFRNPTPAAEINIIRFVKASAGFKAAFGKDSSFIFTPSGQAGLPGEPPRAISYSLRYSLSNTLTSILFNPIYDIVPGTSPQIVGQTGASVQKVETDLYSVQVVASMYYEISSPDALTAASELLEKCVKTALADEMIARRTPGIPLVRTSNFAYTAEADKYHPVTITTVEEYERLRTAYGFAPRISTRDERAPLPFMARMPFSLAAQEQRKIFLPVKTMLDQFFVLFAEKDSSGQSTGKIVRWTIESAAEKVSKYFLDPINGLKFFLTSVSGPHTIQFAAFSDDAERYFSSIPGIFGLCEALEECQQTVLENVQDSKIAWNAAGITSGSRTEFMRIRAYRIWLLAKYASLATEDSRAGFTLAMGKFLSDIADGTGRGELIRMALREVNRLSLRNQPEQWKIAEQADAKLVELRTSVREIKLQDHIESRPQIADLLGRIGQLNFESLTSADQLMKARQISQQVGSAFIDVLMTIVTKGALLPNLAQNTVEAIDNNTLGLMNYLISGCVGELDAVISAIPAGKKYLTTEAIEKVMSEIETTFSQNDNKLGNISRIFRSHLIGNIKTMFCVPGSFSPAGLISAIPQTIFSTLNDMIFADMISANIQGYKIASREHVNALQRKYFNSLVSKGREELKENFKWVYYSLCKIGSIEDPAFVRENPILFFKENYQSLLQEYVALTTGEAPQPEFTGPLSSIRFAPTNLTQADGTPAARQNGAEIGKRVLVDAAEVQDVNDTWLAKQGDEIFLQQMRQLDLIHGRKYEELCYLLPPGATLTDRDFFHVLGPLDPEVEQLKNTFNAKPDGSGGYPAYHEFIRKFSITTYRGIVPTHVSFEITLPTNNIEIAQELTADELQKNDEFMQFISDKNTRAAKFVVIRDQERPDGTREQMVVRNTPGNYRIFNVQVSYQAVYDERHAGIRDKIGILPHYSPLHAFDQHASTYCDLLNYGQVLQEDSFRRITEVTDTVFVINARFMHKRYELYYDNNRNLITTRPAGTRVFSLKDDAFTEQARKDHAARRGLGFFATHRHVVPVPTAFGRFRSFSKTPFIFATKTPLAVSTPLQAQDIAEFEDLFRAAEYVASHARNIYMGLGVVNVKFENSGIAGLSVPYIEKLAPGSSIGQTTLNVNHRFFAQLDHDLATANALRSEARTLKNTLDVYSRHRPPQALLDIYRQHLDAQFHVLLSALPEWARTPADSRFEQVVDTVFAPLAPFVDSYRLKHRLNDLEISRIRAAAPGNPAAASPVDLLIDKNILQVARSNPSYLMECLANFDARVAQIFEIKRNHQRAGTIRHEADHAANLDSAQVGAQDADSVQQERVFYSLVKNLISASTGVEMSEVLGLSRHQAIIRFYGTFVYDQAYPERFGYTATDDIIAEQSSVTGEIWERLKVVSRDQPAEYLHVMDQIARSLLMDVSAGGFATMKAVFDVATRHVTSGDRHELADTSYDFVSRRTQRAAQNLQDFAHGLLMQIKALATTKKDYVRVLRSLNVIQNDYSTEWHQMKLFADAFHMSPVNQIDLDLTSCYREVRMYFNPDEFPVTSVPTRINGRAFITLHRKDTAQPIYTVAFGLYVEKNTRTNENIMKLVDPLAVAPNALRAVIRETARYTGWPSFPALVGSVKHFPDLAGTVANFATAVAGKTMDERAFSGLFESSLVDMAHHRPMGPRDVAAALNPSDMRTFYDFTLLDAEGEGAPVQDVNRAGGVKYLWARETYGVPRTFKARPKRDSGGPTDRAITPLLVKLEYRIPNSTEVGNITFVAADIYNQPAFYGFHPSTHFTKIQALQLLSSLAHVKADAFVGITQLKTGEKAYQDFMSAWNARQAAFKAKLSTISKIGMYATFMESLKADCDVYFPLGSVSWRSFPSRTDGNIDKVLTVMRALEFKKGAAQRPDGAPYVVLTDLCNVIDVNFYRFRTDASALDMLYELSSIELSRNGCAVISGATELDLLEKIEIYCRGVQCNAVEEEKYAKPDDSRSSYNKHTVRELRKQYSYFLGYVGRFGSDLDVGFHFNVVRPVMQAMERGRDTAVSLAEEITDSMLGLLQPQYQNNPADRRAFMYAGIKLCLENGQPASLAKFLNNAVFSDLGLAEIAGGEWNVLVSWIRQEIRFQYSGPGLFTRTISLAGLASGFSVDEKFHFLRAVEESHALKGHKLILEDKTDEELTYTFIPANSAQYSERFKISSKLKASLDSMPLEAGSKGYVMPKLDHSRSSAQNKNDYENLKIRFELDKLNSYGMNRYLQAREPSASDMEMNVKIFSQWLPSSELARLLSQASPQAAEEDGIFQYYAADMHADILQMSEAVIALPQDLRGTVHAARVALRHLMDTYFTVATDAQRFSIIKRLIQGRQAKPLVYILEQTVTSKFDEIEMLAAQLGGAKIGFEVAAGGSLDNWSYVFRYLQALLPLPEERRFLWDRLQDAFKLHRLQLADEINYAEGSIRLTYDSTIYPELAQFRFADLEEFVSRLPQGTSYRIGFKARQTAPGQLPRSVFDVDESKIDQGPYSKANKVLAYFNNVLSGPQVEYVAVYFTRLLEMKNHAQGSGQALN
ncbi:hypothetical protein GT347_04270 [Xylophilus rhododendri]|uniref:Uncharacterized protein n=1 Tax=Xylophilus rhododendri TaxID=2697032 RepID=A0A857J203_9BURK|nr:hypothetical protein [Xylophilus rhododendri]QHI97263.1 hypothetical protein GT347_04270 [Xylophilus rhododendri]